jgi:ABC-2 type transport system permease protein
VKGFWPIFKRELFALFVTPLAWVLIGTFLVIQGIHFALLVTQYAGQADLAEGGPVPAFFGKTMLLYLPLIFVCPLLTMRLFAEERRSGTIEALLTAPVGAAGVVLAKYAAALVTYCVMWAPTVLYVVLVARTGEVDWGAVGASYLGLFGIGAGYLSLGTLASTTTTSQLGAAMLSAAMIIALFTLGLGEFAFESGPARDFSSYVSVWGQMADFSSGIIDLRRLVFDASLVVVPLFTAVRTVESWRWG